jgi:predicted RNA-binding protein YlqC (UPF0109 family)
VGCIETRTIVKDLIELISKQLVEHPDDVEVSVIENEDGQVFELRVNPEDMGRVIGKNGRVAKAVRTLIGSAAAKANVRATLDIIE